MSDQPGSVPPPFPGPPPATPSEPLPPMVVPVRLPLPPSRSMTAPALRSGSWLRTLLMTALAISLGVNFVAFAGCTMGGLRTSGGTLDEKLHSGNQTAANKIAIVRIDGVLMDGMTSYAEKQIESAAKDPQVKAVVVRISSPGGSITASDDLHRRLRELYNDQTPDQKGGKKPLVVSMGAMAASGGYYIAMAMPAGHVMAERSTITGSIGVYAAFPNIAQLADEHGVRMNVIKAGEIKDSGSMFHPMSAQERELWQEMVNHAYGQFLDVVEEGRPLLKGKLREPIPEEEKEVPDRGPDGAIIRTTDGKEKMVQFVRRRADGGIFTAEQAKNYGLIDSIGYLQDAIKKAQQVANLGDDYKAIVYEKPTTLFGSLLSGQAPTGGATLDPKKLAAGIEPRLWLLAPQSELAGYLTAVSCP